MGKADLGIVHTELPHIDWGTALQVRDGSGPIAWMATGSMVKTAMAAALEWSDSPVWSVPCLKPLDSAQIAAICAKHDAVVVLEEHSVYGGLCSAVAEIAGACSPTWVCPIGIPDRFSHRCGSYAYLMREHGLDTQSVVRKVRHFIDDLREKDHRVRPLLAA